jgi:hypothetical protein
VELCAVSQRLKLLKRLKEVDIESLAEGLGILEGVKTNTSSVEDRERLAHLIRVTVEVTEQICTAPAAPEQPPSKPKAKRKRQLAKAARRRQRP